VTIHYWDEAAEARELREAAARPPRAPLAAPETAPGVRQIPRLCACTWKPSYATLPATWTLTKADPSCRLHGTGDGEAA
jgi:hypothetical protein